MTETAAELLKAEYLALFKVYESFNDQSLIIKGWSVTVGMAALIAAYAGRPTERPGAILVILAACSVLPFYLTDAVWKAIQAGYLVRLAELESAFRSESMIGAFQMFTVWGDSFGLSLASLWAAAINPTVFLPHLPIFLAGLLLAWFRPPNPAFVQTK
jgi:hypothetical protein